MTCIEYGRNILIIDAGLMFPEQDMAGVDYLLPDWDYLRDKKDWIRAVLLTHGHLDHTGALHHFLQEINVPVYATGLTRGLVEARLREERMLEKVRLHTYAAGDRLTLGPFVIEPYHVCHSIPDSVGLGITTPAGLIVHSGDFKLDPTPVDGWPTDMGKLAEFRRRGVLALLSDSTNAEESGTTPSEAVLSGTLDEIVGEATGRLIVATFSSLISRIQQIIDAAERHGRRVAIAGRSMKANTQVARELGYLNVREDQLIDLEQASHLPSHEVLVLATGSQGEPLAVLNRLATGTHPTMRIEDGDTVILSSHTIPGNEEMANGLINRLFKQGADVVYSPLRQVHVSGHASQDELRLLIETLQPRFFVPVHGELRHLVQHAKLAHEMGIPKENIAVVENGYPLTLGQGLQIGKRLPNENIYVDGSRVGEIGAAILAQRDGLAHSGFVTAVARYDRKAAKAVGEPRIITQGFVFAAESEDLLARAADVLRSATKDALGARAERLEDRVEQALSSFFYRETRRRPVVTVALLES